MGPASNGMMAWWGCTPSCFPGGLQECLLISVFEGIVLYLLWLFPSPLLIKQTAAWWENVTREDWGKQEQPLLRGGNEGKQGKRGG